MGGKSGASPATALVGQARRAVEQTEKDKLYGQHQQTVAEIAGLLKQTEVLGERAESLIVRARDGMLKVCFFINYFFHFTNFI